MHCSLIASVVYAVSVVTINWTLLYGPLQGLNMGYCSLGYAICLSQYIAMVTQVATSLSSVSVQRTLQKINISAAMDGMCQFVALGVPGTLMLISEWWAFEMLLVMSSRLGTEAVAAQTIMSQTVALAFMVPLGKSTHHLLPLLQNYTYRMRTNAHKLTLACTTADQQYLLGHKYAI